MDYVDLSWHLAGFAAPALALALGMATIGRIFGSKSAAWLGWIAQAAINFAVGGAVLVAGLVWTGHDGRMVTYAALVLASALCQAWLMRRR